MKQKILDLYTNHKKLTLIIIAFLILIIVFGKSLGSFMLKDLNFKGSNVGSSYGSGDITSPDPSGDTDKGCYYCLYADEPLAYAPGFENVTMKMSCDVLVEKAKKEGYSSAASIRINDFLYDQNLKNKFCGCKNVHINIERHANNSYEKRAVVFDIALKNIQVNPTCSSLDIVDTGCSTGGDFVATQRMANSYAERLAGLGYSGNISIRLQQNMNYVTSPEELYKFIGKEAFVSADSVQSIKVYQDMLCNHNSGNTYLYCNNTFKSNPDPCRQKDSFCVRVQEGVGSTNEIACTKKNDQGADELYKQTCVADSNFFQINTDSFFKKYFEYLNLGSFTVQPGKYTEPVKINSCPDGRIPQIPPRINFGTGSTNPNVITTGVSE